MRPETRDDEHAVPRVLVGDGVALDGEVPAVARARALLRVSRGDGEVDVEAAAALQTLPVLREVYAQVAAGFPRAARAVGDDEAVRHHRVEPEHAQHPA